MKLSNLFKLFQNRDLEFERVEKCIAKILEGGKGKKKCNNYIIICDEIPWHKTTCEGKIFQITVTHPNPSAKGKG